MAKSFEPTVHNCVKRAKGPAGPRPPCRSASEVYKLFGYSTSYSLTNASRAGAFPPPDVVSGSPGRKKYFWSIPVLEAEAARRGFKLGDEPVTLKPWGGKHAQ